MTRYLIPPTPSEDLPPPPPTAQDFNIPDEAYGARTLFGSLQPGEQLAPEYWDEANRANSTRAAELQNQFLDRQREILHIGPDAYLNKTGRDAVLAAPNVLAQLEATRQDTIGQAANEAQRRLLTSALGEHRITEHYRVGTHAGEQSLEWQKQTATERLNQLRQQAARDYADPGSIEAYARAGESAARERARTMKFGPDSVEAFREVDDARSSIWRRAIEAALGKIDTKSAIILYNQAADRMTPADSGVLAPQIDAAKEHQTAQNYLASLAVPDTRDPGELDTAHRAATEQNEKDWPDNDSQRATNQHLIDVAFGQKRRDAELAQTDLLRQKRDWLDQPGEIQRPPLRLWTQLSPSERQAVDDHLLQANFHPSSPNGDEEDAPVLDPQDRRDTVPPSADPTPEADPSLTTKVSSAASVAVPGPLGEAVPEVVTQAGKAIVGLATRIAPYLRFAGPGLGAALPILLSPGNTQETTIDLGEGLRAQIRPGQRTIEIERNIDGSGGEWRQLSVNAFVDVGSGGRREFHIDAGQLEDALGEAEALRVLERFARALLPDGSLTFPQAIEIRMAETGRGKKVMIREASQEEIEGVCSNYPRYLALATEASSVGKAAGLPSGKRRGQIIHREVELKLKEYVIEKRLNEWGLVQLSPEFAILNGVPESYSKGSSRIDIVEVYRNKRTVCAYDLKTGGARFRKKKMIAYTKELNHELFVKGLKSGYRIFVMPIPVP